MDTANHSAKFIEDLNIQKQLVIKKIENMNEEYSFFNYNLISAKILFKSKTEEAKDVPKSPPSGDQAQWLHPIYYKFNYNHITILSTFVLKAAGPEPS